MKKKLKPIILSQILSQGFDKQKINSYSLNRKGNGIYQMIIFFGGKKTASGDKRYPDLPIGKDKEVAFAVMEIIDDIMTENETVDITRGVLMTDKKDSEW